MRQHLYGDHDIKVLSSEISPSFKIHDNSIIMKGKKKRKVAPNTRKIHMSNTSWITSLGINVDAAIKETYKKNFTPQFCNRVGRCLKDDVFMNEERVANKMNKNDVEREMENMKK